MLHIPKARNIARALAAVDGRKLSEIGKRGRGTYLDRAKRLRLKLWPHLTQDRQTPGA
jgi:hypothetical protein